MTKIFLEESKYIRVITILALKKQLWNKDSALNDEDDIKVLEYLEALIKRDIDALDADLTSAERELIHSYIYGDGHIVDWMIEVSPIKIEY